MLRKRSRRDLRELKGMSTHNIDKISSRQDKMERNHIQKLVNQFIIPSDCQLLNKRVHFYDNEDDPTDNEQNKSSTRSVFILRIYQYIKALPHLRDKIPNEILQIAAIGEYDMTIMYHENHIRDQKYGIRREDLIAVEAKRKEKENLIIARDQLIEKYFQSNTLRKVKIANRFMHQVHDLIGMMLDKEFTTLKGFDDDIYPDEAIQSHIQGLEGYIPFLDNFEGKHTRKQQKEFDLVNSQEFVNTISKSRKTKHVGYAKPKYLKLYFARCFLLNVIFYYVHTKLLINLYVDSTTTETKNLISFARHFGLIQQIANDISDYIPVDDAKPTSCKYQEDTFSDLRENNVTLPVIYFLSQNVIPTGIIRDYLKDQLNDLNLYRHEDQEKILLQFLSSGALSKSMSFGAVLASHAKNLLDPNNPATTSLNNMLSFAESNQYYEYYNRIKKSIR